MTINIDDAVNEVNNAALHLIILVKGSKVKDNEAIAAATNAYTKAVEVAHTLFDVLEDKDFKQYLRDVLNKTDSAVSAVLEEEEESNDELQPCPPLNLDTLIKHAGLKGRPMRA